MEFIIKKFFEMPDERIQQLQKALKTIILDLQKQSQLNLSLLESIIVPDDFGKELVSFQREHKLLEGFTHNEHARAFAKVLDYKVNGEKRCTIFLDKHIVAGLYGEETQQFFINTIHHELCHVHDDFNMMNIFGSDSKRFGDTELSTRLYDSAWGAWSEYFALRTSASTLPKDSDLLIPFLIDVVNDTKEKIQEEINLYRYHRDLGKFFPQFEERVYFLIKMAATVIGNIHGATWLPDELVINHKNELFKENYFEESWKNLWDALDKIYGTYPNWSGLSDFDPVSKVVEETWNAFGIFPEMTEEGLYIHVP
ncbi:hypothetical protein [Bacillus sp. EB01]|uniref:hypothetical protein n=1 Tax=Bacillus sp. EB01 TaxID=1347086 RepID=UPI0005C66624|nr:hypothetical protein [Bacillus sp. EB01]